MNATDKIASNLRSLLAASIPTDTDFYKDIWTEAYEALKEYNDAK